jgi:hypothetical protein
MKQSLRPAISKYEKLLRSADFLHFRSFQKAYPIGQVPEWNSVGDRESPSIHGERALAQSISTTNPIPDNSRPRAEGMVPMRRATEEFLADYQDPPAAGYADYGTGEPLRAARPFLHRSKATTDAATRHLKLCSSARVTQARFAPILAFDLPFTTCPTPALTGERRSLADRPGATWRARKRSRATEKSSRGKKE